jgi:hypothetical protein
MDNLIKRCNCTIVIVLIAGLAIGCAKKPDKSQVVAEINNYQVTMDDFRQEAGMGIPDMSSEQILQDIITKELLLQEAQKMKLDKDRRFMKEIENYWKQALIKRIIDKKGKEFLSISKVSDDEVKTEYNRIIQEEHAKSGPYEKMAVQIREKLKMKKAQDNLERWIISLKDNARVIRHDDMLKGIKLNSASSKEEGGAYEE